MFNTILFDLDGTLANTDPIHFQIWQDLLQSHGLDIDRTFYQQHISGRLNADILRDLLPHFSAAEGISFSRDKEALFRRRAANLLRPLAGLMDLLTWIDDRQFKQAVVTNAPPENARFMLETLGLAHVFPIVVLGDEVERGKPDPMPYQEALRRLGAIAPEAIAFEDSPSGVRSASGAGIFTIGVATTHTPMVLQEAGAAWVIDDFTNAQLQALLTTGF
jgi:HAD superfamily hydrolase (TIGR01509 family)